MSRSGSTGGSGTHANRPASAAKGSSYYETDTGLAFVYDGAAWQAIKPGQELGYAEITSNFTTTTTASPVDVTGLSTTVTVGARPILVEGYTSQLFHSVAGATPSLRIYEDGVLVQTAGMVLPTAGAGIPVNIRVRRNPAAGSHTYKVSMFFSQAGTLTLVAAATVPAFITVTER